MNNSVTSDGKDPYLSTLLHISSTLNSSLDLDEVLKNAIDLVVGLLKAERGVIMLMESGVLNRKIDKWFGEANLGEGQEISQSIVQEVITSGKPVLTMNAMDDLRFSTQKSVFLYHLRSVLCVPLLRKGVNIGVIYLDNRWKSGIFSQRDLETLVTFANHASIAIENAQLYQNLKDSIDEKLKLQEEVLLEKMKAEVEHETSKLRENLVHYIVHDLRNPLTVIMSGYGLLESCIMDMSPDPKKMAIFERAKANLRLLGEMLNDILDVYRLENRDMEISKKDFNFCEIISEVFKNSDVGRSENVVFEQECDPFPFMMHADPSLIYRVLINLVNNSCKWTRKGYIKIEAQMDTARIVAIINVSDTGIGIPEEYREKVFSKFFRLERTETRSFSKGMGLAFCRLAIEAHGGTINALENPNGGTNIKIILPVDTR
jgi:K+-sensing histidine kinase KdpD